jgi:radical SAM protein with 4Fe4S-binding SPASM domain
MQKENYYADTLAPTTAVLEMTYQCNHRCIFCSVPWENPKGNYSKLKELTPEEWMECIDGLIKNGVRVIALSGGEPLLKDGLEEIIKYAKSKKVRKALFDESKRFVGFNEKELSVSVITNGELINKRWVKLFKKYGCNVSVSLPGIDTFEELTGGTNYKNILSAIQALSDAGLNTIINICVTKKNLPELEKNISLGFSHGAKQLLLNRFLPGGRGLEYSELCLNKAEINLMLDIAEQVCVAANHFGSIGTELPKCIIEKEYKMIKTGTLCAGGINFFAIDPSGKVRPCNHSPERIGDFRELETAVKTDYWQKFKCKDFLPENCSQCVLSLQCDGGCREAAHIVGGKINSADPVFWKKYITEC